MNFIAETDRFARQLEAWKKGHGFSDQEALRDLAYIWDRFKVIPERKAIIYPGSPTSEPPKTELSCGSCVQDLLQFVVNWRAYLVNEVTVDFKGVPQANVEVKSAEKMGLPKEVVNYDNLKMHELRSFAKKKGVEYTNKTTAKELIKLISERL